jgi:hypothetical protein
MELAVRSADLQAAAAALLGCSARLEDAGLTFARQAQADLADSGASVAAAAARGIPAVEHAVATITTDIDRLARALVHLAEHYPALDRSALPPR